MLDCWLWDMVDRGSTGLDLIATVGFPCHSGAILPTKQSAVILVKEVHAVGDTTD